MPFKHIGEWINNQNNCKHFIDFGVIAFELDVQQSKLYDSRKITSIMTFLEPIF